MDNNDLQKLLEENERLRAENAELRHDQAYGILTQTGLHTEYRKLQESDLYAIFMDLDGIHALNEKFGDYETVDSKVRNAFNLRNDDLVLAGRWKSGDEILFVVRTNPRKFIRRLQDSLIQNGLSATCSYQKIAGNDLTSAVDKCIKRVYAKKAQRKVER